MLRLKDDPKVLEQLGLEPGVLEAPVSEVDLDRVRLRLEQRIADGAAPVLELPSGLSGAQWWLLGLSLCVIAGGMWLAGSRGASDAPSPVEPPPAAISNGLIGADPVREEAVKPPVVAEAKARSEAAPKRPPVVAPELTEKTAGEVGSSARELHGGVESSASSPAKAPTIKKTKLETPRKAKTLKPQTKKKPTETAALAPVETAQDDGGAPGDLTAQLTLYELGRSALKEGRFSAAIGAFQDYRTRYPKGALRAESGVSLLEAYLKSGRDHRALKLARALAGHSTLAHRRGEFLRVQAEILARMGRCADAERRFEEAAQSPGAKLVGQRVLNALRHCRAAELDLEDTP